MSLSRRCVPTPAEVEADPRSDRGRGGPPGQHRPCDGVGAPPHRRVRPRDGDPRDACRSLAARADVGDVRAGRVRPAAARGRADDLLQSRSLTSAATTTVKRARSTARASGPTRSAARARARPPGGSRWVCGTKNGRFATVPNPARPSSPTIVARSYWRGLTSKHELPPGEVPDAGEERRPVVDVVEGAEERRRGHRLVGREGVEVADVEAHRRPEPIAGGGDHLGRQVDAVVAKAPSQEVGREPAVTGREVEHDVARSERRAEPVDHPGAMSQVGTCVGVLVIRPAARRPGVLGVLLLVHRPPTRISGCRRTKRAMLRACHSVWRERNRLSITAA